MTTNTITSSNHPVALGKLMLTGAGAGLLVILFFVLGADQPNPEWGKYWMIRPLLVTPLAGATGGVFFYLMDNFRAQGGWKKAVAITLSILVFFIALWMGIILGLAGTMWN